MSKKEDKSSIPKSMGQKRNYPEMSQDTKKEGYITESPNAAKQRKLNDDTTPSRAKRSNAGKRTHQGGTTGTGYLTESPTRASKRIESRTV